MRYEKVEVGSLVTLRQGFAINKKTSHHMSEEPTRLHLLRIGDMKEGTFSVFVKYTIPTKFIAKEDDIIYTRTGQVGLVFRRQYGVIHNNCFTVTTNNPEVLRQQFLYYALQEKSFYEEANSRATGAAQPDLPHSAFNSIQITLPPVEKQDRITDILDAYEALIDNNQRQIKLLEEAAQRLYKEWFVDLRFPRYENTPIVDGVPEGWREIQLFEYCSVLRRGISPKYNQTGQYWVINQKCIRTSIMDMTESRRQEKDYPEELNIRDTDTVICSTGTGTLGRVGQVYGKHKNTTFDSHVTLVRARKNCNFIYQVIKSNQSFLMGMGRGSTNQQELYKGVIETLKLLVPPDKILVPFENIVSNIHSKITALVEQIAKLKNARDRLLPKLMSGEIEV